MATSYKVINGKLTKVETSDINETAMQAQQQVQYLNELMSDTISESDLLKQILGQYTVTTPDGEVHTAADMVGTSVELPPKLGQKWQLILDPNAKSFAYQLVADPNAVGTHENPIIYTLGVPKLDNYFYMIEDTMYVYMSGQFVKWDV